ncbi:EAL domain-containing protein [Roseomonas sp. NAR14]|uniref:EAL domain-containing protein n=1 Tax=Roseomonas acroporae TaxID=2937791 RepID=A0A9X2BUH1_9PROT|nr:EAL domain-containing protein [Roseomonas acroporae]MCK8784076.1 EAL domain-containing protein [Roseomonas acroporae]
MPTIVILDDRITNRNIFSRLAASLEDDVTVQVFGDPLKALEWLDHNAPDLVVTDYKMPNIDGAEFTRRLREKPHGAEVPVVVITAYDDRSFRLRALEAGATDFLQSPVDHYEFTTRARNLLKLRKQQLIIRSRAQTLERELEDSERSRQALLRNSLESLTQVIDTVPAMISATDRQGRCIFVNAHQARIAGSTPAALAGLPAAMFGPEQGERSRGLDRLVFETGKALGSYEEEIEDASGVRRTYLTNKAPLRDGTGDTVGVLTTAIDITDRKVAEARLRHMAHHDSLTDLPNRVLLAERLGRELARSRRGGRMFALHFLDLDRFKAVNDALGHQTGDRLLREVAGRLLALAGEEDTVARLGGDEFAVVQTGLTRRDDAADFARRVTEAIAVPFFSDSQEISLGASVGITLSPDDGGEVEELLRNADLAMYRAKSAGGDAVSFFESDMDRRAREAIVLAADLRAGLAREQFVLHYQPQVSLRTGQVVGAEALLRWQRPGWGLLRPGEFLPLAEENGLIVPINQWVLREACAQAKRWADAGLPPVRMAVNLSPIQFRRQDVRQVVTEALEETGFDPNMLDLELTEGILMEDAEAAASVLRDLKDLGVRLSIDDFGTGYSSLSYVKNFPVDRLKIDQSFVRNLRTDPSDTAIVRAIITLGHSLNVDVLAEGVETVEQLAQLMAEGCDEIQGYYFSQPLEPDVFAGLVRRRKSLPRLG